MAMRFTTKTVSKLLWVYPMSKTRRDKGDKMKNYQFMVMNHVIYAQKIMKITMQYARKIFEIKEDIDNHCE